MICYLKLAITSKLGFLWRNCLISLNKSTF